MPIHPPLLAVGGLAVLALLAGACDASGDPQAAEPVVEQLAAASEARDQLGERVAELEAAVGQLPGTDLTARVRKLSRQVSRLGDRVAALQQRADAQAGARGELATELDGRLTAVGRRVSALEDAATSLRGELAGLSEQLAGLSEELGSLQTQLDHHRRAGH